MGTCQSLSPAVGLLGEGVECERDHGHGGRHTWRRPGCITVYWSDRGEVWVWRKPDSEGDDA